MTPPRKFRLFPLGHVLTIGAIVLSAVGFAIAQNEWVSPQQSKSLSGIVLMCLNGSGQAVPLFNAAGTWQCAGAALPVSGAGGGAVTVADGADVAQGALADAACATDNGTCSELALLKRANQRLTSLIAALASPFQAGGAVTPLTGTFTNRSGAMTAGGTSQTLAAVNASRRRLIIQNPCTAAGQGVTAESLYINFTSAAAVDGGTSVELAPCGSFDSNAGPVSTEAITVNAATTGHKWIAKEM